MMKLSTWIVVSLFLSLFGCGDGGGSPQPLSQNEPSSSPTVSTPHTPVADGGDDQAIVLGESLVLHGRLIDPPSEALTFQWSVISSPVSSTSTIKNRVDADVTWALDTVGFYLFELKVNGIWVDYVVVEVKPDPHQIRFFFLGTYAGGGEVRGTFSYDYRAQPIGTNLRGLSPNYGFQLTSWQLTADGGGMPKHVYESGKPGNHMEFCQGQCIVGKSNTLTLTFRNESSLIVQLIFENLEPFGSQLPQLVASWGPWIQGVYRVGCLGCVPVSIITIGVLTEL